MYRIFPTVAILLGAGIGLSSCSVAPSTAPTPAPNVSEPSKSPDPAVVAHGDDDGAPWKLAAGLESGQLCLTFLAGAENDVLNHACSTTAGTHHPATVTSFSGPRGGSFYIGTAPADAVHVQLRFASGAQSVVKPARLPASVGGPGNSYFVFRAGPGKPGPARVLFTDGAGRAVVH